MSYETDKVAHEFIEALADFLQTSEPSPRLRSRLTEVRAKAEKLLTPEQYNEALGKAKRIAEWNLTLKRRVGETMAGQVGLAPKRITLSQAKRLYGFNVKVGGVLIYDRLPDFGGLAPTGPVAYGATEEEARENARLNALAAHVPPEHFDGEAYEIVPDEE